jgi:hypothetical protein
MANPMDLLLRRLATIPTVGSKLGVFLRMDGPLAVVNVGDSVIAIPVSGFFPPIAGMSVQIEARNGRLILTGPSAPLPNVGVVSAGGSPKCTVIAGGTEYLLGYVSGYVPVVGDTVGIDWTKPWIQGKFSAVPVAAPPLENPAPAPTKFENLVVMSADSGSFIERWWTSDVYNGNSNTGAWFYGPRVADALRGATVTKIEIFLNPRQASGNAPQVGTHTFGDKPGGNVAVSGQIGLEPRSGWVQLPLGWAGVLQAGGGIGVTRSGYTIWRGLASDAMSGALRFSGAR